MKYVAITGASSGIGRALAKKFAQEGHNLIVTARRTEMLESLKKEIGGKVDIVIRGGLDLTETEDMKKFYSSLASYELEAFINNAGFGDFDYFEQMDLKKLKHMVELNVGALTLLSHMFVKDYKDKNAVLLNVSSVGGYRMMAMGAAYCATKFYVSALTEGIAESLKMEGARLQAKVLAPGATRSEFMDRAFSKSAMERESVFGSDAEAAMKWLTADELASHAYDLYKSDKVVGIINTETNEFSLRDPMFPNL